MCKRMANGIQKQFFAFKQLQIAGVKLVPFTAAAAQHNHCNVTELCAVLQNRFSVGIQARCCQRLCGKFTFDRCARLSNKFCTALLRCSLFNAIIFSGRLNAQFSIFQIVVAQIQKILIKNKSSFLQSFFQCNTFGFISSRRATAIKAHLHTTQADQVDFCTLRQWKQISGVLQQYNTLLRNAACLRLCSGFCVCLLLRSFLCAVMHNAVRF